jgi:hypothetical protein
VTQTKGTYCFVSQVFHFATQIGRLAHQGCHILRCTLVKRWVLPLEIVEVALCVVAHVLGQGGRFGFLCTRVSRCSVAVPDGRLGVLAALNHF